ncbi:MAG TPA: Rrf2 family transcriptional regulator [bacterium]|nr:Rrf2 family transcriptional regulator [bacterium]
MLTQSATYALRAMVFLAKQEPEKPVLSQTIAEKMEIPRQYLSRILNTLVRNELLSSVRGSKGGFMLAKPAGEIHLRAVVTPFMDLSSFRKCFLGLYRCQEDEMCRIQDKWKPVIEGFERILDETTIDQVL